MSNHISFSPYQQFQGLFIPNFLLRRREISSDAKILYSHMVLLMAEEKELHLSLELISDEVAISLQVIKSAYKELEHYKLIETITNNIGSISCRFIYSDMLYGTQRVARDTQKTLKL